MSPALRIPPRLERRLIATILGAPPRLLRSLLGSPLHSPDGLELDVQLQALLWMMRATKEPPLFHGSLAQARARMERSARMMDHIDVKGVTSEDLLVPGGSEPRAGRLYRPLSRGRGGLVWFHGGGFVVGSIASHEGICRALAVRSGVTVLSVDYRLAPEHRFPAGLEDAVAATRWALSNAAALGLEPDRIAVGGDSAGGNLSAVVARTLAREERRPAFQLLVYPATDATRSLSTHTMFKDGFLLTAESMAWFIDHWLSSRELLRDPRVSPHFEESFADLPPALVVTAGFDPLRDEGRRYAERLREAGNQAELLEAKGMVHGFINMGAVVRAADRVIDDVAVRLRRALA